MSDPKQHELDELLDDLVCAVCEHSVAHDGARQAAMDRFLAARVKIHDLVRVRAAPREPSPRVAEIRALVDEYEHANAATVATMGLPAGYGVVRLALIRELLDMVATRPVREPSPEAVVAALKACPSRPSPEGLLEVSALTIGEMAVALRAAYAVDGVGGERAAGEGEPE